MTSDSSSASASTSTTPMVLTPDSTGTSSTTTHSNSNSSPASASLLKKARRQTAFYPNVNSSNKPPQKPFSRSAAKRESVMALGSIEHLQHYFTKTGIAAKKNPLSKPHHGLVPAIGGLNHVRTSPSVGSQFELPPSPIVPSPPPQTPAFPYVKTSEFDAESLLPGVVEDLAEVARVWGIDGGVGAEDTDGESRDTPSSSSSFDVLAVLKTTTRTIRSIRNYLVSLPDESTGTIRAHFRPNLLGPAPVSSNASPPQQHQHQHQQAHQRPDPLSLIRKSALEVLSVLQALEERCRLPLSDDAYDAHSDVGVGGVGGGSHSHLASPIQHAGELLPEEEGLGLAGGGSETDPHVTYSLVQVHGRYQPVPVWEDMHDDDFEQDEDKEEKKRERWDERLVVGSGWLYRQDVKVEELEKERRVVGAYLDVVDEVLFEWKRDGEKRERGWERERRKALEKLDRAKARGGLESAGVGVGDGIARFLMPPLEENRRRVSTGMIQLIEEPEEIDSTLDDDELPIWAQRSSFLDDHIGRAHAFLSAFLPPNLLSTLQDPTTRTQFLGSLSSGQLLCTAYNACVRKSRHPWGYVSRDSIHDIIALEKAEREEEAGGGGKKGWTFRRTDNLRLWTGALKLRYMLQIQTPPPSQLHTGPGTPAGKRSSLASASDTNTTPIVFDAKVVAKKEDGWEDMLEAVLLRWVEKAVEEKRRVHHWH